MKYVYIKQSEVSIIEDPVALFKSGEYDESRGDQLYQLGPQVTIKTTIEITPKKPYRGWDEDIQRNTQ